MAKAPKRLVQIDVRIEPKMSRLLLQQLREVCIDFDHCEMEVVRNKRQREPKLRRHHRRALETLRLIAGAAGQPGVANVMRKLARDCLKEVG